jgi:hypothetical protein
MAESESTDDDIPAIDDESREMLESDVKKGKARKFILVCKGAQIRSLVVFKKGPYGPRINKTKKSGFRGEFYCGVVTGKGVNVNLQLPGNPAVSAAMNAEGNVYEDVPCKISKLRSFFAEEAELKFKPEITIVTSLSDISVVDEDDTSDSPTDAASAVAAADVNGDAAAGAAAAATDDFLKQKLQDALSKLTPHIKSAIAAAPNRKNELLQQAAGIRSAIEDGQLNDAKTELVAYGALLKQIAAGGSTDAVPAAPPVAPDQASGEYERRLKALMPGLKQALSAGGPLVSELKAKAEQAQSLHKRKLHDASLAALDGLEKLIASAQQSGRPSDAAAPARGAEKWEQRLRQLEPRYYDALDEADDDYVKKLRVLFTYATEQAEAHQYTKALTALDRLEPVLDEAEAEIAAAAEAEVDEVIKTGAEDFDAFRECLARWNEAVRDVREQVDELKAAMLESDPDAGAAAERLEEVFEGLDWWLERQLAQGLAAPTAQQRQAIATEVRALAAEYADTIAANPVIQHADANPFGVTVRIEETLREPLEEMLMHLHFEA